MALIGKIRKNSWLLVVLIALGLGGFIIMDMTSGQQSVFGSGQTVVGNFEGEKLDWREFYNVEQVLYSGSASDVFGRRDQLWNYFVEEALVKQEAEELGLGVSKTELTELEFGPNPSTVIVSRFQSQQAPGTVDRQQLDYIKGLIESRGVQDAIDQGQLNPNFPAFWSHQRKEITKIRLQEKISALASKAMYTPTWMAEMGFKDQNLKVDMTYVQVPFDEIDNTEVTLEDSDFEAYIKENEATFRQEEETRRVDYVVFNVTPTAEDSAELKQKVTEMIPDFASTENDSLFAIRNNGIYNPAYATQAEVTSKPVADTVFKLPVGNVFGPYEEAGEYKLVKVIERHMVADSADTRHILLSATTPAEFNAAKVRMDSFQRVLEEGTASFDSLAIKYSQDPGSASEGGVYENVTPNQFVAPFNKVLFITGEIGKLYQVRTQFGWHLVEVLSRSASQTERVKVAYVAEPIVPSKATQDQIYTNVVNFRAEHGSLEELAQAVSEDPDLELVTSPNLSKNDFTVGALGTGQESREIVRWAFIDADGVNAVSEKVYVFEDESQLYNDKYVIVGLKSIQKAGLPDVANIRSEIEPQVLNKKKAEIIKSQIEGKSMADIAAQYETSVDSLTNVSFSQTSLGSLGAEPAVIGTAIALEEGEQSAPIVGNSGVFVVKLTRKPTVATPTGIPQIRQQMSSTAKARVPSALIQAMRENADVTDNRSRFY